MRVDEMARDVTVKAPVRLPTWQSSALLGVPMEASGAKRGMPEATVAAPPPKKANLSGAAAAGSSQQVGGVHTTRRIKPLRA